MILFIIVPGGRLRFTFILVGLAAAMAGAQCIDGKWDPNSTWIKDCSPDNQYDGVFGEGAEPTVYTGSTQISAGTVAHTLSWKLHYFKGNLSGSLSGAKLPLIVGLHPWSDGST
ncbi:MAG: hypothetical protein ABI036_20175, partial [Fibrobacteria bacterium]